MGVDVRQNAGIVHRQKFELIRMRSLHAACTAITLQPQQFIAEATQAAGKCNRMTLSSAERRHHDTGVITE